MCPEVLDIYPRCCVEESFFAPPRRAGRYPPAAGAAAAMALCTLSEDEQRILFVQLCNVLEPRIVVYFSSTSSELRELTQALLQQLRADHEAAAALCLKVKLRSCKKLREAKKARWLYMRLSEADLVTLGTLASVLPALEELSLVQYAGAAGPDGVQRLAAGLGAGALPAVTYFSLESMHVGDAGASALAAALGRGALPRLMRLYLTNAAIGDAGLVALAPALRQLPALETLGLESNPLGDDGIAALVAPPPLAGALSPPAGGGVLVGLKKLYLGFTHITDVGCAALASALDRGTLPALRELRLLNIPASVAAKGAVHAALATSRATIPS